MMIGEELLPRLVEEAQGRGGDMVAIRAMIEEASDMGALKALRTLGLEDEAARRDMDELRELLRAWRDAKSGAIKAVIHWVLRLIVALALIGLAAKVGITGEGAAGGIKDLLP